MTAPAGALRWNRPRGNRGGRIIGEVLTIEEIERRYAPDWFPINNPRTDDQYNLLGGEVISASKDRNESYRKATELDLRHSTVHYLGTRPEEMIFLVGIRRHSIRSAGRSSCEA